MEKVKTIIISSEFPAAADSVWMKLLDIATLKHITKPMITFTPAEKHSGDLLWIEGGIYSFIIRLLGVIPFGGSHTIAVKRIDAERYVIQTHEHNKTVSVWNHRIELNPLPNGNTQYSDIVEMYAGWLTPAVVLWSRAFYRHRQRKWVTLLHAKRAKS